MSSDSCLWAIKWVIHFHFGPLHWDVESLQCQSEIYEYCSSCHEGSENTKRLREVEEKGDVIGVNGNDSSADALCSSVAAWLCNETSWNQEQCRTQRVQGHTSVSMWTLWSGCKASFCLYSNTVPEACCCSSDPVFMPRSGLSAVMSVIWKWSRDEALTNFSLLDLRAEPGHWAGRV